MKKFSIEEIIKGIGRRNNEIFKFLYKENFPSVRSFILSSGGTPDDAKDIFQESLIILYQKICDKNFKIETSISAYIFSICKNLWYHKNRKKETFTDELILLQEEQETYLNPDEFGLSDDEMKIQLKRKLLQNYFRQLNRMCQKILQLFYKGSSHDEIAKLLKITNALSRKRKKECMDHLIQMIKQDPSYGSFYES